MEYTKTQFKPVDFVPFVGALKHQDRFEKINGYHPFDGDNEGVSLAGLGFLGYHIVVTPGVLAVAYQLLK